MYVALGRIRQGYSVRIKGRGVVENAGLREPAAKIEGEWRGRSAMLGSLRSRRRVHGSESKHTPASSGDER